MAAALGLQVISPFLSPSSFGAKMTGIGAASTGAGI